MTRAWSGRFRLQEFRGRNVRGLHFKRVEGSGLRHQEEGIMTRDVIVVSTNGKKYILTRGFKLSAGMLPNDNLTCFLTDISVHLLT